MSTSPRKRAARGALAAAILAAAGTAAAAPIEFRVAEFPNHEVHGDSYVLVLSEQADIDHARALIRKGAAAGATIAVVKIAAGPDGRNRDVRAPGEPLWSWHQTAFEGFGDFAIELCDGWPGYVEQDVERWIANTDGTICFWNYTVVEELPEPGAALGIAAGGGALAAARRKRAAVHILDLTRFSPALVSRYERRTDSPGDCEPSRRSAGRSHGGYGIGNHRDPDGRAASGPSQSCVREGNGSQGQAAFAHRPGCLA